MFNCLFFLRNLAVVLTFKLFYMMRIQIILYLIISWMKLRAILIIIIYHSLLTIYRSKYLLSMWLQGMAMSYAENLILEPVLMFWISKKTSLFTCSMHSKITHQITLFNRWSINTSGVTCIDVYYFLPRFNNGGKIWIYSFIGLFYSVGELLRVPWQILNFLAIAQLSNPLQYFKSSSKYSFNLTVHYIIKNATHNTKTFHTLNW